MKQNLTVIKIWCIAIIALTITACNSGYEKAKSGMTYRIKRGSGKDTLKTGNWIKYNVEYKLLKKDSVLYTTYGKVEEFAPVDLKNLPEYNISEIFGKLHSGDKVDFVLNVDSMVKKKFIREFNEVFKKGDQVVCRFELLKVYQNEDACKPEREVAMGKMKEIRMKEREEMMKKEKANVEKNLKEYLAKNKAMVDKQIAALKDYATKNNLKVDQTALGTLVTITNAGTGSKPKDGQFAQIMYRGYLENGKIFDANFGADAKHTEPLPMKFGEGGTIPGFEDGLKLFSKGAKGKILIPAALAYQDKENQGIPANSNLIFDIEMSDLSDTMPMPKIQTPPPSTNENHDGHKH